MRIRSIKPEFWRSDDIDALDWHHRLVFIGLWSYVDDNGVGLDKLAAICADLFAADLERDPRETFARVSEAIQTFSETGLIQRYTVDGKAYFYVTGWPKHQRVDKPNKARYPLPTSENAVIRESVATPSRDSYVTPAPGTGEQGNRGTEGESETRARDAAVRDDHPIPEDWHPNDVHRAKAIRGTLDLDFEADQFRNHALSHGRTAVNWDAAFHTWLGKAKPRNVTAITSSQPAPREAASDRKRREQHAVFEQLRAEAAAKQRATLQPPLVQIIDADPEWSATA
ncbi:hypothetical protein [Nocardia sp. NPDC057455]|uniref:hypothetical protein n=1 Tax=Nocardia sp. NPDC057455 TaxID=3346138 RepID=UPI00366BC511